MLYDGTPIEVAGGRQRALLAVLATSAREVASRDLLVEALWGETLSDNAANRLAAVVGRLRKALPVDVVATAPGGHRLDVDPGVTDIARFEHLVSESRSAEPEHAARILREALALWRGPALAEFGYEGWARPVIARLDELRRAALEARIDADLALGRGAELVPELEVVVGEEPLHEAFRGQLMLALYRSGRQADALAVYRSTRELLDEELGLEPSRALRDLERRILAHDPTLLPEEAATYETPRHQRRRRWLLISALAIAGATAVGIVLGLRDGGQKEGVTAKPNTVVRIDPHNNRVVESYPVGRDPAAVVATNKAVWVTSDYDRTLARVDLGGHSVKTVAGVVQPGALARDSGGYIYALSLDTPVFMWRLDPRTAKVVRHYALTGYGYSMAVSGGSLWVADWAMNTLDRFDLDGGYRAEGVKAGTKPLLVISGYGALWVTNATGGTVSVIRPGIPGVQTLDGLRDVKGMAAGEGGVWVASGATSAVTKIDPDTRRKVAEIAVARDPLVASGLSDVAVGAGSVWAVNRADGTIVRINPRTNKIVTRIQLPGGTAPRSIDIAGNAVWVTVGTPTASS